MIYFDNAATSKYKPESVYNAYVTYLKEIGTSPGRGSYSLGVEASRMLYKTRKAVCSYFGNTSKTNVVFTKNSTEAINLFFHTFLKKGDHILISCFEHNAVLRPLHHMKEQGIITYTVLPESVFANPKEELFKYINNKTRIAAITLASNLTGQIVYSREFGETCKNLGLTVFVDASQGAGKDIVNMERDYIDYLAFTGHKDLYGLPGSGGLCSVVQLTGNPLIQGGTGIHGEEYTNPCIYPEGYESGTPNMPAIWALKSALEFLEANKKIIKSKETALMKELIEGLCALDNTIVYNAGADRVSTVCFNVKGIPSSDIVALLDKNGICVRGGIHCAILAHQAIGTVKTGAVRVSINFTNTSDEIDSFLKIIRGIRCI